MDETRSIGRIIKIHRSGWGFISSKEIEFTRIFFHWTALRQDTLKFLQLKTGMLVEFTPLEIPDKGYRAMHIRVVEKPANEATEEGNVSTLSESESGSAGAA